MAFMFHQLVEKITDNKSTARPTDGSKPTKS